MCAFVLGNFGEEWREVFDDNIHRDIADSLLIAFGLQEQIKRLREQHIKVPVKRKLTLLVGCVEDFLSRHEGATYRVTDPPEVPEAKKSAAKTSRSKPRATLRRSASAASAVPATSVPGAGLSVFNGLSSSPSVPGKKSALKSSSSSSSKTVSSRSRVRSPAGSGRGEKISRKPRESRKRSATVSVSDSDPESGSSSSSESESDSYSDTGDESEESAFSTASPSSQSSSDSLSDSDPGSDGSPSDSSSGREDRRDRDRGRSRHHHDHHRKTSSKSSASSDKRKKIHTRRDDVDRGHRRELRALRDKLGVDRLMAGDYLCEFLHGRGGFDPHGVNPSVLRTFTEEQSHRMSEERNKNECVTLCRIIDAQLEQKPLNWHALEIAVRRLAGVMLADEHKNWQMCTAIEGRKDKQSFLPDKHMKSVLKKVAMLKLVESVGRPGTAVKTEARQLYESKKYSRSNQYNHPKSTSSSSSGGGGYSGSGSGSGARSFSQKKNNNRKGDDSRSDRK